MNFCIMNTASHGDWKEFKSQKNLKVCNQEEVLLKKVCLVLLHLELPAQVWQLKC